MAFATASATERQAVTPAWQQLRTFLAEELKPAPGKMRAALVRVAGVVLAMCAGFALNLPEMSAVVSLAFFGASTNHDESKKVALGVPPLVLVILLVLSLVLNIFSTAPLVRTTCFIVIVFGSLFMLQAAREGEVFLLAGIFGKVFLELWDAGYPAFLTQELSFWIVVDLGLAGLCALFVSSLFGTPSKDPVKVFRAQLASHFELIARSLEQPYPDKRDSQRLRTEAFSAQEQLMNALDAACKKDKKVKSQRGLFTSLIQVNELLSHECVVLHTHSDEAWRSPDALTWSGARCRAIADMVRTGNLNPAPSRPPTAPDNRLATQLVDTVVLAEEVAAGRSTLPSETVEKKRRFFRPDAFTNSLYLANAARAFAAAFACYCLISGAHWSGIGTAVTTCLITSLTTVEQARQKQSLRIAGAAVGGILTLFVIIVVLPTGLGISGLVVVTAVVTFISGWIFAGGPNLNYAGVQVALCYFLGVFGESKTPTSLTSVRDRVAGIFIGNLAMWLFYDRIRPAWTIHSARRSFAEEVDSIARLVTEQHSDQNPQDAIRGIAREREVFARAHSELVEMSDTTNPAFTPWARAQQKDAPEVRYAEAQLQLLFSREFVHAGSAPLGLPGLGRSGDDRNLRESLLSLGTKLRSGEAIENPSSSADSPQTSSAEVLHKIQNALATLFSASRRTND